VRKVTNYVELLQIVPDIEERRTAPVIGERESISPHGGRASK
jgi:hypothetical protein